MSTDLPCKQATYVILHESPWHSIVKDVATFAMIAAVIGTGAWLVSSAMQWCGFLMLVLAAFALATERSERLTPQQAADYLWRDHGVQARADAPPSSMKAPNHAN